jgi:hypothetical protein
VFGFLAEVLVERTGSALIRVLRPRADPSDTACIAVGLLFWAGVLAAGAWIARRVFAG